MSGRKGWTALFLFDIIKVQPLNLYDKNERQDIS